MAAPTSRTSAPPGGLHDTPTIAGEVLFRLTTLGTLDLHDATGRPAHDLLAQPKRVALLAYLAVEGSRRPVPRDRLLALFWPEADSSRARNALSQALHHLRQALGADAIDAPTPGAVQLRPGLLTCDAVELVERLERGDAEAALALYQGEFCPSLHVSGAPEVEQWLDAERAQLARRLRASVHAAAERQALARDLAGALAMCERLEQRLAQAGDDTGAAETRALAAALRDRTPAGGAPKSPASAAVRAIPVAPTPTPDAAAAHDDRAPALPPQRHGPASRVRAAMVALAVVVAVVGVLLARRPKPAAAAATGAATSGARAVAVLPFTLRGPAPLAFLRDGMVDLLSAKLDGSAGVRAVDPRAVIAAVAHARPGDPDLGAAVARRLQAGWYIDGSIAEVAGRIELNGALRAASDPLHPVAMASVTGDTLALFQLVDDLAGRLLAGLQLGRDPSITQLAAVTTHSLPALTKFLAGEQALRQGLDAQAAAAFRDAVGLDTTFALAQYRLAHTSTWVRIPESQHVMALAAQAARNAQRLTPLARGLLEGFRAYQEQRAGEAERTYRELTAGYPDNVEAWLMLGETYMHYNPGRGRNMAEARGPFLRVLALEPANPHALIHLIRLAAAEGQAALLDSLGQAYVGRFGDADRVLEVRALQASLHDAPSERAAVAADLARVDDIVAVGVLTSVLPYAQDLDAAPMLAARFQRPRDSTFFTVAGRRALLESVLGSGRWTREPITRLLGSALDERWLLETEALLAAEPQFAVPRERLVALLDSVAAQVPYVALTYRPRTGEPDLGESMQRYLLALLSVRLGDLEAARRYAALLEQERQPTRAPFARGLAHGVRAELARTTGNPAAALTELDRIATDSIALGNLAASHFGWRERFLHAELLRQLGRDADAVAWYESYTNFTDLPYAALAHLRAGELLEALGQHERARFHFGRAKRMWRDADAEFRPLAARAEAGLVRLHGPLVLR